MGRRSNNGTHKVSTAANGKRIKSIAVDLDGFRRETAQTIIANLILRDWKEGDGHTRVPEMGRYKLLPEMLPLATMKFERDTLRALYLLAEENIPATAEKVLKRLKLDYEDAAERLDNLLRMRTVDNDVSGISAALGDWITRQRRILALKTMLEIMESEEGTSDEGYYQATQLWTSVAPIRASISGVDDWERHQEWEKRQIEREKAADAGLPPGPNWPWKGLNDAIPSITRGHLVTWLAKTSHGKTIIAEQLAEHFAYNCGEKGYDVLFCHLETDRMDLEDRWIGRKLKVPISEIQIAKKFRFREGSVQAKYEKVIAERERNYKTKGRIRYEHCPRISPSEFELLVSKNRGLADARGRELVVIVDYYTEMDWSELSDSEFTGYNALANFLKEVAEVYGVYMIAFAQFDMDGEYSEKKKGYGGQKINHRSQVVIRVERETAEKDFPFIYKLVKDPQTGKMTMDIGATDGEHMKDTMERPMYFHRKGKPSAEAQFNVLKVSQGETGPIPVLFLNGYFEIYDDTRPAEERGKYTKKLKKES